MVIKSPAASAMRAKESVESYTGTATVKNSRIVRLGGLRNSVVNGSATNRKDYRAGTSAVTTKGSVTSKESAGVRMVYKPAVSQVTMTTPSASVPKPTSRTTSKPVQAVRMANPSVSESIAPPREAPARKSPSPAPFERNYKEEPAKKTFFEKRGEAFPTTRIGAKLSAIQAEFLPQVSFWKVLALSLAAGAFGIAYIHHGFQMQEQLNRVEALENQMERTRRVFAEKQIRYDRLTGPKEIYQKAQEAGFVSSGPANQSIPVRIDTP